MQEDCLPLDNATSHQVSLANAIAWTGTYQESHLGQLRSVYFPVSVFQALIDQPDTKGIRIYLANNGSHDTMVLTSATEDADLTSEGYLLYDDGHCSPPCIVDSPLQH